MADHLNEALLKLISLFLRIIQFTLSLVIVGCMSQFLSTLSEHDSALPQTHVAVLAISCVGAVWSLVALLLTCCAGKIILELETTLDLLCVGMSIAQAAMLSKEASCTRTSFWETYMVWNGEMWTGYLPDRRLVKTCFGCAVVAVVLFASTSMMSWAVWMIKKRHQRSEMNHHRHVQK
ncbi:hypothetical protein B0T18DRAFT_420994 [Schizothecium vesticola]|uniref:MARVEL domain-containing protein n=1 Tax=Schizothecium vesticola TaxID=314040 RepID=A0AA40BPJ8_9PEZI|nr:hypothetical protein B0T18DRAFT_420994 [Schizothecium vesticola]